MFTVWISIIAGNSAVDKRLHRRPTHQRWSVEGGRRKKEQSLLGPGKGKGQGNLFGPSSLSRELNTKNKNNNSALEKKRRRIMQDVRLAWCAVGIFSLGFPFPIPFSPYFRFIASHILPTGGMGFCFFFLSSSKGTKGTVECGTATTWSSVSLLKNTEHAECCRVNNFPGQPSPSVCRRMSSLVCTVETVQDVAKGNAESRRYRGLGRDCGEHEP